MSEHASRPAIELDRQPLNEEVKNAMQSKIIIGLVIPLLLVAPAGAGVMPWEVHKRTLPNGLDVLVIPTPEFRQVVNFNTLILAGSRNELEKGRSGLAHLFEHIAFRHRFDEGEKSYSSQIDRLGAFNNAWTWFDVTYYHPVTFTSNLEALVRLEAERFVDMQFTERIYRTEAGAVLGEYRRIASDPGLRMDEVISDLAYGASHGYGHTTLGYLQDVEDMPNSYRAGRAFYETFYRPNNAVVLVTGDVDPQRVFALVEQVYGSWQPRPIPEVPDPRRVGGPKKGHVDWESDVPPQVDFAYRVPAFEPGTTESSVIMILPELISGETAPLYQKLRYEEKLATSMATDTGTVIRRSATGFDPRLLETYITLDKGRYDKEGKPMIERVVGETERGLDELKNFSSRSGAARTLAAIKSRFRYDLLAALDSPAHIAETFSWYYRFNRNPDVLDQLVEGVDKLTPQDIDSFARKHFVPANRVVVTMEPKSAN
ncbi:MAG TPA: pitrilysin family protein [Thermoanaerobaculia bacterium]|nr:pitrilysin family protein [Thermoanaerobaculia bacterium]